MIQAAKSQNQPGLHIAHESYLIYPHQHLVHVYLLAAVPNSWRLQTHRR